MRIICLYSTETEETNTGYSKETMQSTKRKIKLLKSFYVIEKRKIRKGVERMIFLQNKYIKFNVYFYCNSFVNLN